MQVKVRVRERRELAIPCLLPSGLNLAFCLTSNSSLRVSRSNNSESASASERKKGVGHSLSFCPSSLITHPSSPIPHHPSLITSYLFTLYCVK